MTSQTLESLIGYITIFWGILLIIGGALILGFALAKVIIRLHSAG